MLYISGPPEIESNVCFLPMITERSRFFLRLYSHYKNKHLVNAGGILDQPNIYLEAMELISGNDNGNS